jgi:hypothetical protein
VDRRFFIQTMMGGLAATGLSLDELPEWFLDPPRGRSQVIVPREVRLVLPVRKFTSTEAAVRYAIERRLDLGAVLQPYTHGGTFLSENELVRFEKKGENEIRQEKIDGVWRVKRD